MNAKPLTSLPPLRRIGILGGMGPAATVDLMRKIIDLTPAECDQEHIPLVVWNVPQIPSRLAAIHDAGESPVDAMCEGARWLAHAGAEAIAIACNTAHHWAEDVASASGRPVLHIADSAIHALKLRPESRQRVMLLATTGTHYSGFYAPVRGSGPESGATRERRSAHRQHRDFAGKGRPPCGRESIAVAGT